MINVTPDYLKSRLEADRELAGRRSEWSGSPPGVRQRVATMLIRLGAGLFPSREEAVVGRVVVMAVPVCDERTPARAA